MKEKELFGTWDKLLFHKAKSASWEEKRHGRKGKRVKEIRVKVGTLREEKL